MSTCVEGVCPQLSYVEIIPPEMKVFYRPIEQFQKLLSVPVVPKDGLSLVASGRDVVVRSRIFYPQRAGHERDLYHKR